MAEQEQAYYTAWAEDAQRAWDDERAFCQPVIEVYTFGTAASLIGSSNVSGTNRTETPRAERAEKALEAITSIGWQLHTRAVVGGGRGR